MFETKTLIANSRNMRFRESLRYFLDHLQEDDLVEVVEARDMKWEIFRYTERGQAIFMAIREVGDGVEICYFANSPEKVREALKEVQ